MLLVRIVGQKEACLACQWHS